MTTEIFRFAQNDIVRFQDDFKLQNHNVQLGFGGDYFYVPSLIPFGFFTFLVELALSSHRIRSFVPVLNSA